MFLATLLLAASSAFAGGVVSVYNQPSTGGSSPYVLPSTVAATNADNNFSATQTFLSSVTINNANGLLVSRGSVTASAFFGDGSHLTLSTTSAISISSVSVSAFSQSNTTYGVGYATASLTTTGNPVWLTFTGVCQTAAVANATVSIGVLRDGQFLAGYNNSTGITTAQTLVALTAAIQDCSFSIPDPTTPSAGAHSWALTAIASGGAGGVTTTGYIASLTVTEYKPGVSSGGGGGSTFTGGTVANTTTFQSSVTFQGNIGISTGSGITAGASSSTMAPAGFLWGSSTYGYSGAITSWTASTAAATGSFFAFSTATLQANLLTNIGATLVAVCVFHAGAGTNTATGPNGFLFNGSTFFASTTFGIAQYNVIRITRIGPGIYDTNWPATTTTSATSAQTFIQNTFTNSKGNSQIGWPDGTTATLSCGCTTAGGTGNFDHFDGGLQQW